MANRVAKDKDWIHSYFAKIEEHRGLQAVTAIKLDIADQWAKGHRGQFGLWHFQDNIETGDCIEHQEPING
jgi:hypothetical protein